MLRVDTEEKRSTNPPCVRQFATAVQNPSQLVEQGITRFAAPQAAQCLARFRQAQHNRALKGQAPGRTSKRRLGLLDFWTRLFGNGHSTGCIELVPERRSHIHLEYV
jgi:hypothetical protein